MLSRRLCSVLSNTSRRWFSVEVDNASFRKVLAEMSPNDIHQREGVCVFDPADTFVERHLGSSSARDLEKIFSVLGVSSMDELLSQTIPDHVRLHPVVDVHDKPISESESVSQLHDVLSENRMLKNFIGQGYYGTITPGVIQRNLLENPAWYTAYTPYQAEISQGRLEGLFVFQTLVANLTKMDVSNCSLLDEGTAAAEAMAMFARASGGRQKFLVASTVHSQTIAVVKTRARWMGISVEVLNVDEIIGQVGPSVDDGRVLGALVQFPDTRGVLVDYTALVSAVRAAGGKVCVAADPLTLTVCEPPIADAFVGTLQRFGVPLWYGGPHPGFLATGLDQVRRMPGRLVGKSIDAENRAAFRLTLQTREQHIRLDKATSNICTAQALLANMAAMYAIYHGPTGLQRIAMRVHALAETFHHRLGLENRAPFFDTVCVFVGEGNAKEVASTLSEKHGINLASLDDSHVGVSFDETHTLADVDLLVNALMACGGVVQCGVEARGSIGTGILPHRIRRTSKLLPQEIFNTIQTETEMMRYLYRLQLRDLSLTSSMITLGSCTMKLNSVSSLVPSSWATVANVHPFTPVDQLGGYMQMLSTLEKYLCDQTGFAACSLQPSSGASGEYAGLLAIRRYQESVGEGKRNVVIVPKSAHGTNPASAAMMGLAIRWIGDDTVNGLNLNELRSICESTRGQLSALMITYPSTRGVFETHIREICSIIHEFGGLVYMDGANMNAQLGLCSPGDLGADVCHLNLHKTFSIPHGGGGPGMGPICVTNALKPFLPSETDRVSCSLFGQAGIASIPYMFITMLGSEGLKKSAQMAILNANYMVSKLRGFYEMPFLMGESGRCSHEFIIDVSGIKETSGVAEEDIAKRLMDYGFHAPTMSWPVHSSLMIEPTESENIGELDRFCEAMISIRHEIKRIESGEWDRTNNPLKNAPHTQSMLTSTEWNYPYTRKTAAFPLEWIEQRGKFWPSVARINNAYGEKHLVLTLQE